MDWRDRIVIDPAIHHGDPCVKGTRVPLSVIVGSIAGGDTFEQVLVTLIRISPPTISGGRSELGGINCHDGTHRYRDLGGSHARNPGFRGHPRPAEDLFDYLKNGDTLADFLDDFPTVSHEQAVKVLELAEEDLIDAAVAGRVVAKEAQSSPRAS